MSGPEESKLPHEPVLYQEIIHGLQPRSGGIYLDGTVGAGGHAWGILEASSPDGQLLGLDVDPQALALARQRLAPFGERARLVQASYTSLKAQLQAIGWPAVDGIVLDLGVSSLQLDTPERGFSFRHDAPLDMRFDPNNPVSAAELVNGLSQEALAEVIFRYGEERYARQIARAIVQARPVRTTGELVEIITGVVRKYQPGLHPATRTFQALRIATNQELEAVAKVLPDAVEVLMPKGRLAVIAFHSLEDRIVKTFFRQESRDCLCPPKQPVCTCGHHARLVEINRKPIQASPLEIHSNPRARSARLRIVEKI
jgi:16S rRNA (cytosine1402-N4)-methyltransferase